MPFACGTSPSFCVLVIVMFALTFSKNAKPMTVRRRVVAHTHDEFLALDLILPNWLRLLKTSWRKNEKEIDDDGHGTDGQEFLEDTIAKESDCNNKNAMSVLIRARLPSTPPHGVICAPPRISLPSP